LGAFLGFVWFIVVIRIILSSDNFLKKLFKHFGVMNTITDEHQPNEYIVRDSKIKKEFEALNEKQKQLTDLKDRIKAFKDNIEKLDFLKNFNDNNLSDKFKNDFEDDLNGKIEEILNKSNGEFEEEDMKKLNKYLNQLKKIE